MIVDGWVHRGIPVASWRAGWSFAPIDGSRHTTDALPMNVRHHRHYDDYEAIDGSKQLD
jgi:hypothetical protein